MDTIPSTRSLPDAPPATLFLALELSRSTWLVALHAPATDKVGQHRLGGGDAEGLLDLIVRKRVQAEEKLGRPVRVACCFEAGYDGFWLHRWLCAPAASRTGCWARPACWWTVSGAAGQDRPP